MAKSEHHRQLLVSYGTWATLQLEVIETIGSALEREDYDTAAKGFEKMAKSAAGVGVRVRAHIERMKAKTT